jgi:oligopeptide/dipeptide ABC transporter ATP-binding protein
MGELLRVVNVVKHFPVRGDLPFLAKRVHALDGISFSLHANGSIGLVGESGSGKTTLARCIMKLERPASGDVLLEGRSIYRRFGAKELRRRVQMVFQDPGGSLNPRFSAEKALKESLVHLRNTTRQETGVRVRELFRQVGMRESDVKKLPHQFSGGQQQRIAIARALAPDPDVLILDEPTSALDLSLQAQIITLLESLRRDLNLAYVLITHDLSVVRQLCDELLVMYLGRPVEFGTTHRILTDPKHPYSRALIGSILHPDPQTRDDRAPLHGEIPSPIDPPPGCRFHPRCPNRLEVCSQHEPEPALIDDGTTVLCHLYGDAGPKGGKRS